MSTTHNGFRFAELARGESLQSPDTCDCCGREGLKKTIKLVTPGGSVVWYGTGCAARAMSCKPLDVRRAREAAIDADRTALQAERDRAFWAEYARFQAFLDARVPSFPGDRARQLEALGGYAAAKALFAAA